MVFNINIIKPENARTEDSDKRGQNTLTYDITT